MIQYDEKTGIFHLRNEQMSYVLQVMRGRYLMHRYWGRALRTFRDSRPSQGIDRAFSPQPAAYENERTFSLDVLPQEYPAYGHTDYRIPAYEVRLEDGTTTTELFYKSHEIQQGKPALTGLPASYAGDAEAETLLIQLEDSQGKLAVCLSYTVFAEANVIARSVRIENSGTEALDLLNAASFALDLPDHDYDRINLWGRPCPGTPAGARAAHARHRGEREPPWGKLTSDVAVPCPDAQRCRRDTGRCIWLCSHLEWRILVEDRSRAVRHDTRRGRHQSV